MPTFIKLQDGRMSLVDDAFTFVADDVEPPPGDIVISLTRFQTDGDRLAQDGRQVGVRLSTEDDVDALAYDLPRIAVVEFLFPRFRDGRHYSNARILRERYGFKGQIRAVGDVLREQAGFMVRCGFDAFEPADGSTPEAWEKAVHRFRHVYQRASDPRTPAFAEREG